MAEGRRVFFALKRVSAGEGDAVAARWSRFEGRSGGSRARLCEGLLRCRVKAASRCDSNVAAATQTGEAGRGRIEPPRTRRRLRKKGEEAACRAAQAHAA
ncbi:hypothetical protein BESB_053790 [Besnoitia besnoiti]|uniref:Uncharacterized protein n=1 Tax=Besnoitia besnoiti TaxID=94643 RepID=A0A2A9MB65_BESBE|nr:hypothetical protein BESB_053790 [Besnoitia besnoiti]PFH35728.1 hypothetical protein BESB_053790 [Besnoitia besnoiti]